MPRDDAPPASPPAVSDTLDALAAWDRRGADGLWPHLSPEFAAPFVGAWEPTGRHADPAVCLDRLRRRHRAQAAPDPARIHPSWLQRALAEEPPTVAGAVAASLPAPFKDVVRSALVTPPDPPERTPHPGALAVAMALWSHRLVGDEPPRDDDAPAVAALTLLDTASLSRLFREVGIGKWAAIWPHRAAILPPDLRDRIVEAQPHVVPASPAYRTAIEADIDAIPSTALHPELLPGLAAFGRLLATDDLHRARWALQHVPYNIARLVRRSMIGDHVSPSVIKGERQSLERAWRSLEGEGRLDVAWRWTSMP